jgi:hypothetical protein
MKLQMKRQALVTMYRQATEMPFMQICATYFGLFPEQWALRQEIADPQCKNSRTNAE